MYSSVAAFVAPLVRELEQGWKELAGEEQGRRGVAAVELVAHVERAADDRPQRDAACAPHGLAQNRPDDRPR